MDDTEIEDELDLVWTVDGFSARVPPNSAPPGGMDPIGLVVVVGVAAALAAPFGWVAAAIALSAGLVLLVGVRVVQLVHVAWETRVTLARGELTLASREDVESHALHRLRGVEVVNGVIWIRTHEGADRAIEAQRLSELARERLAMLLAEAIAARSADPRAEAWAAQEALEHVRRSD